ncbi:MAG: sulfate ABC transporter substrate-binding protein [Thermoguttaceae bacterium]
MRISQALLLRLLAPFAIGLLTVGCAGCSRSAGGLELLNVSYDPTREFYSEFNQHFANYWEQKTGQRVTINMSHAGSSKQALAVISGLEADVVTLALAYDIDAIAQKAGLLPSNWQDRLPHRSTPYTSTIVFLVRKGNPKGIQDWGDLIKPGVSVITPHPKTSGGARWNYLAAWGYVLKRELKDFSKLRDPGCAAEVARAQQQARQFVAELFTHHVPVLDSGARGATMSFVNRGTDDVLLAWENEAFLVIQEQGPDKFEIVVPSVSILAEPPVALVDAVVQKHGTGELAQAYLEYLYCPLGQTVAAKHFYRPRIETSVPQEYLRRFPKVELFTVDEVFGGWERAHAEHFAGSGIFDQIYKPG